MRIIIIILFISICFGTNSCQKPFAITATDSTIVTNPFTGTFTAVVDGVPYVADKLAIVERSLNLIAITGVDKNNQKIVLVVRDSGVHVYTLNLNSTNDGAYAQDSSYAYATNQGSSAAQSGGTLSITAIDTVNKIMSGTFSMQVYRALDSTQKNITRGVFNNITYTTQPIPPASSTDTFRVKVDGVQFPVFSIEGVSVFNMISLSSSDQPLSRTVGVTVPSNVAEGTYTFNLFGPDYIGQYNVDTTYMSGDSGSLTILEHNTATKRIRGNFAFHASEFIGTSMATLTEGYFSIVYQ